MRIRANCTLTAEDSSTYVLESSSTNTCTHMLADIVVAIPAVDLAVEAVV
jgi:hypothetical protein